MNQSLGEHAESVTYSLHIVLDCPPGLAEIWREAYGFKSHRAHEGDRDAQHHVYRRYVLMERGS